MINLKILLFTASRKRPLLLRHCLYQMQGQTYPTTHAIYLNSNDFKDENDQDNCLQIMSDIKISKGSDVLMGYGPSAHQHHNHMAALSLADIDQYDLFLKIDDDDLYTPNYVKDVVADYIDKQWDVSGSFSAGLLYHDRFERDKIYQIDYTLADKTTFSILPGTLAFSKKAITHIINGFSELIKSLHSLTQLSNSLNNLSTFAFSKLYSEYSFSASLKMSP